MSGFILEGNCGVPNGTVAYSGAASGSVVADINGTFQIRGLSAGTYVLTPSLKNYTFAPTTATKTITTKNILGVNFVATLSKAANAFSFTDSRKTPNSSLNLNGTLQYTVPPTPCTVPAPDCRKGGAPVDSRKAGGPVNSRTPSPFKP